MYLSEHVRLKTCIAGRTCRLIFFGLIGLIGLSGKDPMQWMMDSHTYREKQKMGGWQRQTENKKKIGW